MNVSEEYQKIIEKGKAKEQVRFLGKQAEIAAVCEAKNKITQMFSSFQKFMEENKDRVLGKKIMLTNGNYSKLLQTLLDEFGLSHNLGDGDSFYLNDDQNNFKVNITVCVNGGKYAHENDGINTYYCHYVKESFYDVLICDGDGKLTEIDLTPRVKKIYTVDSVNGAIEKVKELKKEMKNLEDKIRDLEWSYIPNEIKY